MSTDRINGIKQRQADIKALELVLQNMDCASGVTISVRCGVARDDDSVGHDRESRPWTTVEIGNLDTARLAIDAAIAASNESLQLRLRWAREEHEELGKFLVAQGKNKT